MLKVLLLNPSNEKNEMVIKDQYCSFTSKADYFWVPIDLLVLSGDLSNRFDLKVIDSTAQQIDKEETIKQVREYDPDHVVILSSLLTHDYDRELIRQFREFKPDLKTTFLGDVFYFSRDEMIKFDEVDSIIYEYPCPELSEYIAGEDVSCNMIYKKDGKIVKAPFRSNDEIVYSTPRHDLFSLEKYSVPFMMEDICTSVLTNFGCKYTCNYCPASSVNFRQRSLEQIFEELTYLESVGIKNIWIRDFTFGLNKARTNEFLDKLKELGFSWFCLSRAETLDNSMISKMSEAGCYLVMIGVDSISSDTMKKISRIQKRDILTDRIAHSTKSDIQVLVHMILGFPGDKLIDMIRTVHFLATTKANFLSINFFSPRAGSNYFQKDFIHRFNEMNLDSNFANFEGEDRSFSIVLVKYYALLIFYLNPVRVFRILYGMKSKRMFDLIFKTGVKQFFPKRKNKSL
ncbi:radical SAM protein [Halobacteriovorax sp. HLS]|uniref:B12-binding domain-containing radical SAM protein n=1 Tax=Halobacteriovorax sp. HLS TaxID=2234000 RepID=UPI000FDB71E2|nr:radical SAM protein [Halobacteriovorax sp. HLS]